MTVFLAAKQSDSTLFLAGLVGREPDLSPSIGIGYQTERIFARLTKILDAHQIGLANVVNIKISLLDVTTWKEVVFPIVDKMFNGTVPPCAVVGVSALVEEWMEIEIEVVASLTVEP